MLYSRFLSYLGSLLITVSVLIFLVIFFPFAKIYFFPSVVKPVSLLHTYTITIPKIHAQSPIIVGVDPWNETEYKKALQHGVAQAKGTALPGESGTVYLFAHSSGNPWEELYFNTIFLRLGELEHNDVILLTRKGKTYRYVVFAKKEVLPTDVSYLLNTKKTQLILQTCTPIGTDWRRLLVFAKPV